MTATNAVGTGAASNALFATPFLPDTLPPSKPASLIARLVGTSQIALDWPASTDNVGVTGYRLYRDGAQIGGNITATNFLDSALTSGSTHTYQVAAVDAAGNQSILSTTVTATTLNLLNGTTGTLSGVIYTQAGSPLQNAEVTVTLLNGTLRPTRRATTASGRSRAWRSASTRSR